jgi:UDP-N-acetylmuramoyl-tripeptide--D-alanyl-D-alanine ligase
MRELGQQSAELHREVGRAAAAEHVNLLIVVGSEAEELRAGALEGGMERDAALIVGSHQEAAARVRERVRPGDFVLIKGSRGARMERVLSHLQEGA